MKEPDLQCFVQAEEDEDGDGGADGDKPKKKKAKKDSLFYKKSKTDPNAPSSDRMPLPELLVLLTCRSVRILFPKATNHDFMKF